MLFYSLVSPLWRYKIVTRRMCDYNKKKNMFTKIQDWFTCEYVLGSGHLILAGMGRSGKLMGGGDELFTDPEGWGWPFFIPQFLTFSKLQVIECENMLDLSIFWRGCDFVCGHNGSDLFRCHEEGWLFSALLTQFVRPTIIYGCCARIHI